MFVYMLTMFQSGDVQCITVYITYSIDGTRNDMYSAKYCRWCSSRSVFDANLYRPKKNNPEKAQLSFYSNVSEHFFINNRSVHFETRSSFTLFLFPVRALKQSAYVRENLNPSTYPNRQIFIFISIF